MYVDIFVSFSLYSAVHTYNTAILHIHFTITNTFLIDFDLLHTNLLIIYADYKFIIIIRKESTVL